MEEDFYESLDQLERDILNILEKSARTTKYGSGLRSKHEIFNNLPYGYNYVQLEYVLSKLVEDGYIFAEPVSVQKYAITNEGKSYLNI